MILDMTAFMTLLFHVTFVTHLLAKISKRRKAKTHARSCCTTLSMKTNHRSSCPKCPCVPGLQPRDILQFVLACWRGWLRATCPVMQILRLSRLLTRVTSSGLPQPLFSSPLASAELSCAAPQFLSSAPRHHEAAALPPPPRARGPHGSGHPRQVRTLVLSVARGG